MNTNFIFITNISKSQKSSQILKEVDNKWAKIILIDNPDSELMDAFLYNPTLHVSHFDTAIAKLRAIEIDGTQPLKVFYVWFPPSNVVITTMIPHGSILLPYLLVDSIPKNAGDFDIIGDLPFKVKDFKEWDVSYKDDKWMILRLPTNQDEISRNYVLSYIRNKRLASGSFPRVSEIFVTEDTRLSRTMVPKHLKLLSTNITSKSNLIFVYDLPAKMSSLSIVDALKNIDFRNCRVSLIDYIDNLRLGFIYTQTSLPEYRFNDLMERLKIMEIEVSGLGPVKLNFSEVWLQPVNCQPPNIKERSSYCKAEYILTDYLYVHNLNSSVQPCDLTQRCPISIKVQLYTIPESEKQFGFVSLKDVKDSRISKVVDYLRSLVCDGLSVLVDEIWLKEYNLPDLADRRPAHISRTIPFKNRVIKSRASESMDIIDGFKFNEEHMIRLANEPTMASNLMKSSLIFLMNLPENVSGDKLLSDLNISSGSITLMETPNGRVGFLYHWQVSDVKWMDFLEKTCYTLVENRRITLKEIYLQCDETVELIQFKLPGIYLSNYVFIYNIGTDDSSVTLTELMESCKTIVRHCTLTNSNGVRCVIVQLQDKLTPSLIIDTLAHIRKTKICDRLAHAELIWFANIEVFDNGDQPAEPIVNYLEEDKPCPKEPLKSIKMESM